MAPALRSLLFPFISLNELTTVAAVYALAPFYTAPTAIGSSSAESSLLASSFTYAAQLVDFTTGTAPGKGVPAGVTVPVSQLNTLANILAACVNSSGGTAGDSSACGSLLSLTTPAGATAPTDIVTALTNLARNPTLNTVALFNLLQPFAPFQPQLASPPANFAVNLIPIAGSPSITVAPAALAFPTTAVNFVAPPQTLTISNSGTGSVNVSSILLAGINSADFTQTSTCIGALAQGATCTVFVAYMPAAVGVRSAALIINSSAPASPQTIALSATAGTPAAGPVSLSVSTLSYTVADTIQDVVVSNFGTTPLTIRSVTVTDPTFIVETNGCGTTLAAQSVCTLSVASTGLQFNGGQGTYQSYSGTLTIDDDAAGGPQTVALSSLNTETLALAAFGLRIPAVVNFGAWPVNSVNTGQQLVLTPGSYYTSASLSYTLGGANASDFSVSGPSPCSSTTFATCTYALTFTPSATGLRTAKFMVGGGQYARLQGTGNPAGPSFTLTYLSSTFAQGQAIINQYGIATVTQSYTLINNGTTTLNLAYASTGANAASYTATGNCSAVAPQGICIVQVAFSSTAVGTYPGAITLTDRNSTYSQVLPQTIQVSYQLVQVAPSSINFAAQAVGTSSPTQTFTIQGGNISPAIPLGHPITVSLPTSGSFTLPAGSACPASATTLCTLSVAFTPTAAGSVSEILTVTDQVSGNTASLMLTGIGGSPALALSSNAISFPARAPGTTSVPMNVTITNSGTVPLTISGVTVAGAVSGNFTQINTCSSVPAGGACTVSITFAPTATGSQAATLSIASNAAGSPAMVALSGSAN